ncbi:MAG: hypothetical protein GY796_31360 [Chloroflexi bacterium]|nr:hypothetical protein [Chloroflexota bacterium]
MKKQPIILLLLLFLASCQTNLIPTRASLAIVPGGVPPTFTPVPGTAAATHTPVGTMQALPATNTPGFIPTNTPVTPTVTPTNTATPTPDGTATPIIKPISAYGPNEAIPYQAFPKPPGDNGWGMHWMPTVSQEQGVVDQFVGEMVRMHIKWVVILNDGTNMGANDYLVDRLVASGIMPVMRLYRDGVLPYDGDLAELVRHYRARGVYYFQLYNEPNVNLENQQGFANPNQYARAWTSAARVVVANGGLPGIGALSPGGQYNHFDFLDRTLSAIAFNGDGDVLNHAWLSVHNYHGTRPYDDPGGFLLFREYDKIVQAHLGRSLPILGTEGGSYHPDPNVETQLIQYQYGYMQNREPYFLAFSYWLIANRAGGGHDGQWEWQTLIRPDWKHPVVTEFFYTGGR